MAGMRERYRLELCERVLFGRCRGKERARILQALLEAACTDFGAKAGSIILRSRGGKKGRFVAVVSKRPRALRRLSVSLNRGIVGWCMRNRRSAWVASVSRDPRYDPEISQRIQFPTRSILCAPITKGQKVIGAVELINLKGNRLSAAGTEKVRGLADAVARILTPGG